jgi:hypothetical protein
VRGFLDEAGVKVIEKPFEPADVRRAIALVAGGVRAFSPPPPVALPEPQPYDAGS